VTQLRIIVLNYLHDYELSPSVMTLAGETSIHHTMELLREIAGAFGELVASTKWGVIKPDLWIEEGFEYMSGSTPIPDTDGATVLVRLVRESNIGTGRGIVHFEGICGGFVLKQDLPYGEAVE